MSTCSTVEKSGDHDSPRPPCSDHSRHSMRVSWAQQLSTTAQDAGHVGSAKACGMRASQRRHDLPHASATALACHVPSSDKQTLPSAYKFGLNCVRGGCVRTGVGVEQTAAALAPQKTHDRPVSWQHHATAALHCPSARHDLPLQLATTDPAPIRRSPARCRCRWCG